MVSKPIHDHDNSSVIKLTFLLCSFIWYLAIEGSWLSGENKERRKKKGTTTEMEGEVADAAHGVAGDRRLRNLATLMRALESVTHELGNQLVLPGADAAATAALFALLIPEEEEKEGNEGDVEDSDDEDEDDAEDSDDEADEDEQGDGVEGESMSEGSQMDTCG